MYGCMYVCMDVWMYGCVDVWMYVCMDVWMYGCMGVWMYGCMDVCMYVWMYGCMYTIDVCMWGVCKMLVPESGRNSRSAWGPPFGEFISHMSSFLKKNQGGLIASAFSLKLFLV